jgi:hypothetical protein
MIIIGYLQNGFIKGQVHSVLDWSGDINEWSAKYPPDRDLQVIGVSRLPQPWQPSVTKVVNGALVPFAQSDLDAVAAKRAQDIADAQAARTQAAADAVASSHDFAKRVLDASDGQSLFLRAMFELTLDQINTLRTKAGLATVSAAQFKTAIVNKIDQLA